MTRFSASAVCRNGDTLLWANPVELPFNGWNLLEWCVAADAAMAWSAAVTVSFTDGSRVVWSGSGASHAPLQLSPLLHYPTEDAVEMQVAVRTSKGTARLAVRLDAVEGAGRSEHRRASGIPYTLDYDPANEFVVPASTAMPRRHVGKILSTKVDNPFSALSLKSVTHGMIHAITAATATTSAWDFARNRFYLFGNDGIFLAVTNGDGTVTAIQHLDNRGLTDAASVAQGNNETGVVALTASREVVRVSGSKVRDTGYYVESYSSGIALDGSDVWLTATNGPVKVFPADRPEGCYLRDDVNPVSVLSAGGSMLIVTAQGELISTACTEPAQQRAEWTFRVEIPGCVKPPVKGAANVGTIVTALTLPVMECVDEVVITVSSDCGSPDAALQRPLAKATVKGRWKAPLTLPLLAADRQWINVKVETDGSHE